MGVRTAKQGSWKKEKSISTEHHRYKDFRYKERINKSSKPTNAWDDEFLRPQRSWKKTRKYQCKDIQHKIIYPQEVPLVGTSFSYIRKDNPSAGWFQSEIYRVTEIGRFWFDNKCGVFLTNAHYPDTTDPDFSTFIEVKDFWNWFERV